MIQGNKSCFVASIASKLQVVAMVTTHLLPVFNGHKAGELGDNGVLLAGVDDE